MSADKKSDDKPEETESVARPIVPERRWDSGYTNDGFRERKDKPSESPQRPAKPGS